MVGWEELAVGGENIPIVLLKIPKSTGTWLLRGRLCSHWRELGEQRSCGVHISSEKVSTVGNTGPFWKRQVEAIQGAGLHSQAMKLEPEIKP